MADSYANMKATLTQRSLRNRKSSVVAIVAVVAGRRVAGVESQTMLPQLGAVLETGGNRLGGEEKMCCCCSPTNANLPVLPSTPVQEDGLSFIHFFISNLRTALDSSIEFPGLY
jgi:hypothetical protein